MANDLPVSVCKVVLPEGTKQYVTLLPVDDVFSQGLAPEAIVGVLSDQWDSTMRITPEVFTRNRVFVEFLHAIIAQHAPNQPGFQAEAKRLGDGWVYIVDQRTPTPEGPVPPEDILGALEVRSGEVVPGSYKGNPNHRILTMHGFFRLGTDLHQCLIRELAIRNTATASKKI